MAKAGQYTKSDFIPINEFRSLIRKMYDDERWKMTMYLLFSGATALRVSDVISTKWEDILYVGSKEVTRVTRDFYKVECKTGKRRKITFPDNTRAKMLDLYDKLGSPDPSNYIFQNRKGQPVTSQYLNAELKRIGEKYELSIDNFSTHSFRKTFARHYWESNDRSSGALIILMDVLNHSSLSMTKKYLGITDEEVENVYTNFEI